jgi:hypothetical protein
LEDHLKDAAQIMDSLKSHSGYEGAQWTKLKTMRSFYESSRLFCDPLNQPLTRPGLEEWGFLAGHDFHQPSEGCRCEVEAARRVAYLFGAAPPKGSGPGTLAEYDWGTAYDQRQRAIQFDNACRTAGISPGEWIKRSSEEGSEKDSPSVAAIVTLLFLLGAPVDIDAGVHRHCTSKLRGVETRWPVGLAAIAELNRPKKSDHRRSTIILEIDDGEFRFRLPDHYGHLDYADWFDRMRSDAIRKPFRSKSRLRDIAAAYMLDEGETDALLDRKMNNVSLEITGTDLVCTWHNLEYR